MSAVMSIADAVGRIETERDRYREAFARLANEVEEHVDELVRADRDWSPREAAGRLAAAVDRIGREEEIGQ